MSLQQRKNCSVDAKLRAWRSCDGVKVKQQNEMRDDGWKHDDENKTYGGQGFDGVDCRKVATDVVRYGSR